MADKMTTIVDALSTHYVVQNTSVYEGCIPIRFNQTEFIPWDNPDNVVSQEVEAHAAMFKDLALALSFLIGGPANTINMAVFYRQGLQDRVNLCLFMLAVFDNLFLTSALCLHAENIYLHVSAQPITTPLNEFMANNNLIFFLGSGFVSCVLSALVACERCYCVLRPLNYHTVLRTTTMACIIAAVSVSVFTLFFIVSHRYGIGCVYDPVTGEVSIRITGGQFYRSHKELIDYLDSILFGAGFPGGMNTVVLTATIITTMKLRRIVTWRTETSSSLSSREVALTKMLLGNSAFFLTCTFPACIFRVACLFLPEMSTGRRHHNFYLSMLWVSEGISFFNFAFNFCIYYKMGSRYRQTMWALFRRNKGHLVETTTTKTKSTMS